jgi:chromosome segregation ATPase
LEKNIEDLSNRRNSLTGDYFELFLNTTKDRDELEQKEVDDFEVMEAKIEVMNAEKTLMDAKMEAEKAVIDAEMKVIEQNNEAKVKIEDLENKIDGIRTRRYELLKKRRGERDGSEEAELEDLAKIEVAIEADMMAQKMEAKIVAIDAEIMARKKAIQDKIEEARQRVKRRQAWLEAIEREQDYARHSVKGGSGNEGRALSSRRGKSSWVVSLSFCPF